MGESEMVVAESAEVLPRGAVLTEQQLDEQVRDVRELQARGGSVMWHLGRKIAEIKEQLTWKLRDSSTTNGKGRYTTFEQFCKHELGLNKATVYRAIDVSLTFKPEDVAKFGTTNLSLMLQVSTESRDALKQRVEEGASTREIEKLVREEKRETGYQKPSTGRAVPHNAGKKKALAAPAPVAPAVDAAKIRTVATREKVKVKLVGANDQPARSAATLPWTGELVLDNHVTQHFKIQKNDAGEFVLFIRTKRDE